MRRLKAIFFNIMLFLCTTLHTKHGNFVKSLWWPSKIVMIFKSFKSFIKPEIIWQKINSWFGFYNCVVRGFGFCVFLICAFVGLSLWVCESKFCGFWVVFIWSFGVWNFCVWASFVWSLYWGVIFTWLGVLFYYYQQLKKIWL